MRTSDGNNKKLQLSRSLRAGGYSVIATVMILAVLLIINFLAGRLPTSARLLDMTPNRFYSFSLQTQTVLKNLQEEVTLYHLVQGGKTDTTVETILERYADLGSNIHIVTRDPEAAPEFLEQFHLTSADNNSIIVASGSRYRYLGTRELYEYDFSDYYATGTYGTSFAGEKAITSAIVYCTSGTLSKVYVVNGHGEIPIPENFADSVKQENIELEPLTLLTVDAVPLETDAILLYAPKSDISVQEKRVIQNYLQNGGNMLLITDFSKDRMELPNVESIMATYGVYAQRDIITEASQNRFVWGMPRYLLPNLAGHKITDPLRTAGYYVLLPDAHGLRVDGSLPSALKVEKLLTTSDQAFTDSAELKPPFTLAVAAENVLDDGISSKIVWVSSSGLLNEQVNQQVAGGNEDFFLNALHWAAGDDDNNLTIHPKRMAKGRLTMNSLTASVITVLVTGLIPLTYFLVGAGVWLRRKRK